jgi:hypothetical protein
VEAAQRAAMLRERMPKARRWLAKKRWREACADIRTMLRRTSQWKQVIKVGTDAGAYVIIGLLHGHSSYRYTRTVWQHPEEKPSFPRSESL